MAQWDKLLKSLGFTDSESKVYLTSLEMGPSSVQDLAKKARVSRVTTYDVIESLAKKGLISTVEKGKKKMFVAEPPERLTSFVHGRVQEMTATLKAVESSLDELKLIQRGEKPVVKLFEGHEALKAIQDDVLRTQPKELAEFGNFDEITRVYTLEELRPFQVEMTRRKVSRRIIFLAKESKPTVKSEDMELIILPPDKFDFSGDVLVYGNKVAFSTFRGRQISVLIESDEAARTMKAFFEFVWHCLAKTPSK